ncbi:4'-phosphopantetheinyl transferase [Pseudarthrobacter chlorophenolicus A6]|uniref:4'-phosphopantetheinyl transferase n=1 Tax=Pseudarthrobacter chlorophenolicus (strain ATCC 700700 / DSM 12829 / CIP 107037 / JCM 12360 / KCTC 9906 / NCIMB 13794 / A6) TaxID=452863 RepID=B8HGB9_PSECP|nr:4'-phosphopantetheinyl transferase superfamily protein [Pseudarthrobacter chlorophenolicus]ACL39481.1 4'-phosphopantetheinyl transferase [Pseudarthrobacter chlorophenolicus A6]SDQ98654.1 4'-phosphopantetheinyl transferase [Pseudarthrobacter chlorophenolicus]
MTPQLVVRAVPPSLLPGHDGSAEMKSAVLAEAEGILDDAELQRGRAMEPAAGLRFLVSRVAQRRFAAGLLGLPEAGLRASYSCPQCGTGVDVSHGAPGYTYRDGRLPLALSLSRAAGWLLLAAVPDAEPEVRLGVDIEDPDRTNFKGFTELALTPAEREAMRDVAPKALPAEHARLWARKEAWLKMTGAGLRTAPSSLDVRALPGLRDLAPAETGLPARLAAAVALSPSG